MKNNIHVDVPLKHNLPEPNPEEQKMAERQAALMAKEIDKMIIESITKRIDSGELLRLLRR